MRKLLIIAHDFPPCAAPGSARPWRFYKYLPEFGYETYVITASRPDGPVPRVTCVPAAPKFFAEKVLRKFIFPYDEDVLWGRLVIAKAKQMLMETPMDVVLSTVPPIHSHTAAYMLKKRYGLRWVADYRDPVIGDPWRASKGLAAMAERIMDRNFFSTADLLLTVTDRTREASIQRHPDAAGKIAVLWNGFDPEENIAAKPIPPRQHRVLAHLGSFYRGRSPVRPLASIARLISRGAVNPESLRLRFIGALDPHIRANNQELFDTLTANGCLELLPQMPRAQALQNMMEADSLILADNNDLGVSANTVPAKLFEYVRVGRPILALTASNSPVERILAMSGVPFVSLSSEMDEATIDARMMEFLALPSDSVAVSERFSSEFDGRKQAGQLAALIDDALKMGSGIDCTSAIHSRGVTSGYR